MTYPVIVYLRALPMRLNMIFSYVPSASILTLSFFRILLTQWSGSIYVFRGLRSHSTIYRNLPRSIASLNKAYRLATYVTFDKMWLTARSLVTSPRLTSLKDPLSLPASRRETSIKVDTKRVRRRLSPHQLVTCWTKQRWTYTFLRAMTSVSYLGDPSFVSISRSSSGPETSVRGVLNK